MPVPSQTPRRRRLFRWLPLASLAGALLAFPLLAPAGALAAAAWTPSPAGLSKTQRTCPEPSMAHYFHALCWSVRLDRSNPFYSPRASYPWAQCTYWALELRPDLWNRRSPSDPDPLDWTAYTWPAHAALEGLRVDHVPAAGAVAVWPQSQVSDTGHVAIVDSVAPGAVAGEQLVTIDEFNDSTFDNPSLGQGDTITLTMSTSAFQDLQFIHQPGYVPGASPSGKAKPVIRPGVQTRSSHSRSRKRHRPATRRH